MSRQLALACLLVGALTPAVAGANPEPTAYDTRSIAMGLTGTSYMERPSALVLNPANMEGIEKLGFSLKRAAQDNTACSPTGPRHRSRSSTRS